MNNEFGFTCLACGQFRPGPEGAHSEAECLRVQMDSLRRQLAAVTAERDRYREAFLSARGAWNNSMEWLGDNAEDQTVELAAQQWDYDTLVSYFGRKGDADGQDD